MQTGKLKAISTYSVDEIKKNILMFPRQKMTSREDAFQYKLKHTDLNYTLSDIASKFNISVVEIEAIDGYVDTEYDGNQWVAKDWSKKW